MRRLVALCAVVATGTVSAAAVAAPPSGSATVVLSTSKAGARPVQLTLQLHYEMQCNWPGRGSLRVRLPAGMQVPSTLASGSALLDGMHVTPTLGGRTLSVPLPPRHGVMCDVIGPGTLTFVVTRRANLGNPARPGTYALPAWSGTKAFSATLRIT